ncbi:T6SS effector amidase Tae4 family protein [Phreatobacter stygius]|nr:T6SS effector amidase Tae4 family protein [Phreatobacter stygius]
MAFAHIRANFDVMWSKYPMHHALKAAGAQGIADYIADLKKANPGSNPTPCCLQMSWALNAAHQTIPKSSYRRPNAVINGRYHIGAVDELEMYLTSRYGRTENVKRDGAGNIRSLSDMKDYLHGRQGILVFRDNTPGVHTELWDTDTIKQKAGAPGGMSEGHIFGQPRILFWEVANTANPPDEWDLPEWLLGWWVVYDGSYYWYYFSDRGIVTYVESAPKNTLAPPVSMPVNSGRVTTSETAPHVVIEWNPTDGGATVEKFRYWGNKREMNGTSNRFSPLFARKL